MNRDILEQSSTLAEYIKKYFNSNSGLPSIKVWFSENTRQGHEGNKLTVARKKVSAIWLYKQLKQYKPNILKQKLVKEALDEQLKLEAVQIVDYFTRQQDSEQIILLYCKYKEGYKSLKTGQEVNRQVQQLRKTIENAISQHLKISLGIGKIKEITDAQFKRIISEKIREQRLKILQDYLRDTGYDEQVTRGITIDKIKSIIRANSLMESKLSEYIEQLYNKEVINIVSDTESEGTSYRTSVSSTNDHTEYNELIRKIKHKAEAQLNKPINKVLLEINSNASQKHGLRIIKLYGINNLNIDLEVNEQGIINKISIKRNGSGNKQDNHTVPVSTFLKSLERHLKGKPLTEITVKNLLHHYGKYLQDNINPGQQRNTQQNSEFDWIKDKILGFDSKILDQKLFIAEKYIIPFIFYEWNTRAEATFRAVKESTAYGVEGNVIKEINKQFRDLIKNLKKGEVQSINDLKVKINEILPKYCKAIDLPTENQLTSKKFGVIISDARRLFKLWFSLIEEVDKNLELRSLLDTDGDNDYKSFKEECLDRQKFGERIIESKQQLTRQQKQSLKNKLNYYITNNPETVDSGSDHSESDHSSSSGDLSPRRDEDVDTVLYQVEQVSVKVKYTSDKIKLILEHYLPQKNIEQVYLIDTPDQYHNSIDNLKQQLIQETKDKIVSDDKFYVVIERFDDQVRITSAILLKLFNKINKNQIKVLPIVGSAAGSFRDELKKTPELSKVSIKVDDLPDWFGEHQQTKIYLNNLIEVMKLSIECNGPCKVGDQEIEEIMSESSIEYEKAHKSILDQANRVSIGEQAGTSGIKRKVIDVDDSPEKQIKKVKFNLENLKEKRDNIGLQASGSGCSTRISSKKRFKRDLCQEKESEGLFPYEPLEESVAEPSKINSRLYSQIAYLMALDNPESIHQNIKSDNVLTYVRNLGDIISEGEINSLREQELLKAHYSEAQEFFNTHSKDKILDLVGAEIDSSSRAWIFDNGKHSLLVSYDGNRYQLYSPDLNYRQSFQTQHEVRFTDIELYAEAFFQWRSNSIEYDLFALKKNLPQEITNKIKQAKFWQPDEVISDLVLLDKGDFKDIDGVPAKVVRELFFLDGKVPNLQALHESFFTKYSGRIAIRVDVLHHVLSLLTPQANASLVNLVKQHNFPIDTAYLKNMPESTKNLLDSYHNQISKKLKTSESITIQELSNLSWKILEHEMATNPEISSELKKSSLENIKELYASASKRAHELGITSQTLFFLPDIIRAMNTGNFEGLQKTAGMMLGDVAFNQMYGSLISKLEAVLPASRIALLKKLPITSPIFKILTINSIIDLHKKLNSLPSDSEEAGIIKHQLGEQYFTIGLMVADLFGLELGPLWIGLMAEQLVHGAIALRQQYHLDISFGEAFLMNLGFEQDKLQSILTARQLVDLNLSLINRLSAKTNTSYGLVIVKVPKMSHDEPNPGNSVIEFKSHDNHFCMEDNVFLENSSGYKRIASVAINEQNSNCVDTSPLQISGDSLAAIYGNNNSTEQQSIYVNFDPNEGDMKLHFTKEGLSRLDKLNHNQQNNANATSPYVVTAQIYHKPYPDQIGLFGNRNHSFILNDDSKRVVSNYYIDGTSSFILEDNTISTSIKFLNRKLFERYNAYIKGNTSAMQVKSIYSDDSITGHIALHNKDYLKLNLEHLLINGKFTIDIPNVGIYYIKGATRMLPHDYFPNGHMIEVSTNVVTFKLLLEAPSISRIDIKNKNAPDVLIDMGHHLNYRPFTLSMQAIHTEYKSHYTFIVNNLQPVLDDMTFTNRNFPNHLMFVCSSNGSIKGWCVMNNYPQKNIISIKGQVTKQYGDGLVGTIDTRDGILTIDNKNSILELAKNTNMLHQDHKYAEIEVVHYDHVAELATTDLRFNQVVPLGNYNISVYDHYIHRHHLPGWNILEFESNNRKILHHFNNNIIQVNDIEYFIKDESLHAIPKNNMDGRKLLINNKEKPIGIFVGKTLADSQISLNGDGLEINNATLHYLSDSTIFIFQTSHGGTSPISLRLLKDSFKYTNDTSNEKHSISLSSLGVATISAQDDQSNINDAKTSSWFSWISSFNILLGSARNILDNSKSVNNSSNNETHNEGNNNKTNQRWWHKLWPFQGAEAAILDSPKSFKDVYELINRGQRDTLSHDIKPTRYIIDNAYHINGTSNKLQDRSIILNKSLSDNSVIISKSNEQHNSGFQQHQIPDIITKHYDKGVMYLLPNIHAGKNTLQAVDYKIEGDTYNKASCRPIEFYGCDSVYCEGKHTNMIYNPLPQSKTFDGIDGQIMFFRVMLHLGAKLYNYFTLNSINDNKQEYVEINNEVLSLWNKSIQRIEDVLNDLQKLNVQTKGNKAVQFMQNNFSDLKEEINDGVIKQVITTENYEIINERLEASIEDLLEVRGQYFIDVNNNKLEETNKGQEQDTSVSNGYYFINDNNQEYTNGLRKVDNTVSILPISIELIGQSVDGNDVY